MIDIYREIANVPEVLYPYSDFNAQSLVSRLHELVINNRQELLKRNLSGEVQELDSYNEAKQPTKECFVVINKKGDIVGSAYMQTELLLQRYRFSKLPFKTFRVAYPYANPHIKAWIDKNEDPQLLVDSYKDLLFRSGSLWKRYDSKKAWTTEPITSPKQIHQVLALSGLSKIMTAKFNDNQNNKKKSVLYAMIYNDFLSRRSKQKELIQNTKGWF